MCPAKLYRRLGGSALAGRRTPFRTQRSLTAGGMELRVSRGWSVSPVMRLGAKLRRGQWDVLCERRNSRLRAPWGGLDHCGMPFSPKGAPLQVLGLVIHWQMGGLALLI